MNKRELKSLQKRLHGHARNHCASHTGSDGCIGTIHGKCILSFEGGRVTSNVCPYFMKSVGPSNPELFDEYVRHFPDGYPLKKLQNEFPDKCVQCFQRYKKASNRQKYCDNCRMIVKREQAKERMKRKRVTDLLK